MRFIDVKTEGMAAAEQALTADQEVIQCCDGGKLAGQIFLTLLTGDVARPGQAIGVAQVVSSGRFGAKPRRSIKDPLFRGRINRPGEEQKTAE